MTTLYGCISMLCARLPRCGANSRIRNIPWEVMKIILRSIDSKEKVEHMLDEEEGVPYDVITNGMISSMVIYSKDLVRSIGLLSCENWVEGSTAHWPLRGVHPRRLPYSSREWQDVRHLPKGWASITRFKYGRHFVTRDDWFDEEDGSGLDRPLSLRIRTSTYHHHAVPDNAKDRNLIGILCCDDVICTTEWTMDIGRCKMPARDYSCSDDEYSDGYVGVFYRRECHSREHYCDNGWHFSCMCSPTDWKISRRSDRGPRVVDLILIDRYGNEFLNFLRELPRWTVALFIKVMEYRMA